MLRVDETIQKTIDCRDRKVSPVIHQTRQQATMVTEQFAARTNNFDRSYVGKSLGLPIGQLSGFKQFCDENNQRGINEITNDQQCAS